MTGYGFFRSLRLLVGFGALACVGISVYLGLIVFICGEISTETSYRHKYGAEWKVDYEQTFGSLSKAHSRMVIAALGIAGFTATGIWLVRALKDGGRGKSKKREPSGSRIERRVRYKRNALLGVYFGVAGILLSVVLAIFRMGIFAEHSDEVSLAIFIFLGGYSAVIYGCYWWLRAKHWSEAVLIIAFMPLIVFFIPFVRLLVLKVLGLLIATMVMSPLILVVVVAALPDKSGHSRQAAPWERRRHRRERSPSRVH